MSWLAISFAALVLASAAILTFAYIRAWGRSTDPVTLVEVGIANILLLTMFYACLLQVVARHAHVGVLEAPWTEEIARLTLIWSIFVGAIFVERKQDHMSIPVLYDALSDNMKRRFDVFQLVMKIAILATLLTVGTYAVFLQYGQSTVTLGVSIVVFSAPVPIALAGMLVLSLMRGAGLFRRAG